MDKSWLAKQRGTQEYIVGVEKFIEFAFRNSVGDRIRCPCKDCGFKQWKTEDVVRDHLTYNPFPKNYVNWTLHGETNVMHSYSNMEYTRDSICPENPMELLVNEALRHLRDRCNHGSALQPPVIQPQQPPPVSVPRQPPHFGTSDPQPSRKRVGRENQRYWTVDTIDSHGAIKRSKFKVKEVLNILQSQRIVVNFNDQHQAIGEEQGLLAGFCGTLATDCALFPINFEKWPDMPDSYFNNCFANIIKPRFHFKTSDEAAKRYVSQSISKKWAQSRLILWNEFYDPTASRDDIIENVPVGIQRDQWATYVDYRLNPKTMEKCKKNAENRAKQTIPHTGGSKPNARRIEEMAAETGRRPGRGQVYLETHKKGDGTYIDSAKEKCDQIERLLRQSSNDETVISTNDAVGKVLGEEHSGRVRCLGLGAVPTGSFRKPRFQLHGGTNPTSVSIPPSQYQQELSQVRESCDTLRNAFKSYLIMKEGHIPEEFVGIFSSPASTPSDDASRGNLTNTDGRSSVRSTSAQNNHGDTV